MSRKLNVPPGTPVIHMDDPNFGEQLRSALGVKPGDEINIITPQFTRAKDDPPPASAPSDWGPLRTMSRQALKEIGCRAWDKPDASGRVLMLLPGEWYEHIPIGFELECINGEVAPHATTGGNRTDDDIRYGCLAYGIRTASV